MSKHNQELGKEGENLAVEHLEKFSYEIIAKNWRFGRAEVDIIAWSPERILVFVEVKTRKHNLFGNPEEAVSLKKQNLLYEAATEFMYQNHYEKEIRFDIIAIVIYKTNLPALEHFQDAFFPSW
jgi:putative endonuclease